MDTSNIHRGFGGDKVREPLIYALVLSSSVAASLHTSPTRSRNVREAGLRTVGTGRALPTLGGVRQAEVAAESADRASDAGDAAPFAVPARGAHIARDTVGGGGCVRPEGAEVAGRTRHRRLNVACETRSRHETQK